MASIYPQKSLERLASAMAYSRDGLRPFMDQRLSIMRQRVGHNYGENGAPAQVYVNFLDLAYVTYTAMLVGQAPQASVAPRVEGFHVLRDTATMLEIALNNLLADIQYGDALAAATTNALDSIGIMKIGLTGSEGDYTMDGRQAKSGRPDCAAIDPDDWVHDMSAKDIRGCQFMGNRYSVSIEDIMESDLFDSKAKSRLRTTLDGSRANDRYDDFGRERITMLSGEYAYEDEQLDPQAELWDLWIPRDKVILTVKANIAFASEAELIPMRAVDWKGPEGETGPFRVLTFGRVPNNTMPMPPMLHLVDLHDLANSLMRKLGSQSVRQKSIAVGTKGADGDARVIRDAEDGDAVLLSQPDVLKEIRYGGIDPNTHLFLQQIKELFSYFGGNIDALAGLSPQADTLGQERLIQGSASKRVASMQNRVVQFAAANMKELSWWMFTDPDIEIPMHLPSPTGKVKIPVTLTQKRIMGRFHDYNFEIHPHSLQYLTPSERLQVLTSVWTQYVLPMMPLIQAEGGRVNIGDLLQTLAKETNVPEIAGLVEMPDGLRSQTVAEDGGTLREQFRASKSPVTTRREVRQSVGNPKGNESKMTAALQKQAVSAGA